uniref:Uncharacterized protein n=1 Tax=Sphenodon punctatus TaxID=8508 RepID=A0A8D0H5M0_SPHPU
MEPFNTVALAVASSAEAASGQPLPAAVEQRVVNLAELPPEGAVLDLSAETPAPFGTEILVPCEDMVTEQLPLHTLVVDQPESADHGALIVENVSIQPFLEADPAAAAAAAAATTILNSLQASPTQMVAYFETIPTAPVPAAPSALGPLTCSVTPPETMLSSALTLPIVSTVPIVSNHTSPDVSPAAEAELDELSPGKPVEEQLEEHRYHKNELSTEELVDVVMGLQKKVKVLQQRHRRHFAKLEAMEGVVEQLRKENLVSEEKLKLLEMACLQSRGVMPDASSTVAIICQEEDRALVYTVPQLPEEAGETIIHVEEQ